MIDFILWYLLIQIIGAVGFILIFNLMPALPDRGYAFSKPFGLLITSYIFWMFTSLHVLQNNPGGIFAAFLVVLILAVWLFKRGKAAVWNWIKNNKKSIIVAEILFLFAFGLWAFMRAASPDIAGTEKPMEMAFINAILNSSTFPPFDPWLSGYAISYYYFGYVMVALLTSISGVLPTVAFNLAVSLWFAMTALGAYGVLYALLYYWRKNIGDGDKESNDLAVAWGWLAPFFILIVSNFEGFFQMLHHANLFWYTHADGSPYSPFWEWLNIKELNVAPTPPYSFYAGGPGWWFWRASRVVQDFQFNDPFFKNHIEIIDEFPNFTYFLADLHPHVLAMPFVLLLIGAALNIYWSRNVLMNGDGIISWVSRLFKNEDPDVGDLRIVKNMARVEFWVLALVLGGLSFLNTWDFPIYTGLICLVVCLIAYEKSGWSWDLPGLFLETGVGLGIAGILFYIPFFLGFASQAGGFLPSLILFTRGTFFWMMFGPLLIPMIVWLVMAWMYSSKSISFRRGVVISLVISVSLWVLSYLFAFLISLVPVYGEMYMSASQGAGGIDIFMVIFTSLSRRLTMPGTWITLVILFGLVLVAVSRSAGVNSKHAADDDLKTEKEVPTPSADIFVLALMLMGLGLTLMPEFFFLRDQFGGRMNTIFKFYFQAWIVWGIAAAFCTVVLWSRWDLAGKIFKPISVLVLGAALVYPMTGFYQRAADVIQTATARNNIFDALTLDGAAYIKNWAPDEMEAIKWLRQAPRGIIVEAVGGSYTDYARYSTFSGQITVLGWPGHESQWRGGEKEKGNRESDIALLYRTNNWSEAQAILSRYQVRYIIVSQREITTYKITPDKFQPYLSVAYRNNSVTIYEVPVQITSSTLNGNN